MAEAKIQHEMATRKGKIALYKELCFGPGSFVSFVLFEWATLFLSWLPGALGLFARGLVYPRFFAACGKGVVFGRNMTIRHPGKVQIADGVIFDDNVLIDAKGSGGGIMLGQGVYIGRNTILSCKGGKIALHDKANLGQNCVIFSAREVSIGAGCMIAAFCHILSGGEYDVISEVPFCRQKGKEVAKATIIGEDCWLGSAVCVTSETAIGAYSVIGAKSLVNRDIPPASIAVGIPAKVIRTRTLTSQQRLPAE